MAKKTAGNSLNAQAILLLRRLVKAKGDIEEVQWVIEASHLLLQIYDRAGGRAIHKLVREPCGEATLYTTACGIDVLSEKPEKPLTYEFGGKWFRDDGIWGKSPEIFVAGSSEYVRCGNCERRAK